MKDILGKYDEHNQFVLYFFLSCLIAGKNNMAF